MTTLEQKIAQQLGLLMLENAKLLALVEDLKAQLGKHQSSNGHDKHSAETNHAEL